MLVKAMPTSTQISICIRCSVLQCFLKGHWETLQITQQREEDNHLDQRNEHDDVCGRLSPGQATCERLVCFAHTHTHTLSKWSGVEWSGLEECNRFDESNGVERSGLE